jgi:hypothetical protein
MDFKSLNISECSWESVKELFLNYHYLKTMPAGILAVYGLFDEYNFKCLGACVFTNGRIQYDKIYIEFARLWITDDLGKNIESFFVSRCLKSLQKKYPTYQGVVTWSDLNKGHDGTIYKALNFVYDGKSRPVNKYQGKNKKTIYQRTSTKTSILIGHDKPKNRFIYFFDKKKREKLKTEKP